MKSFNLLIRKALLSILVLITSFCLTGCTKNSEEPTVKPTPVSEFTGEMNMTSVFSNIDYGASINIPYEKDADYSLFDVIDEENNDLIVSVPITTNVNVTNDTISAFYSSETINETAQKAFDNVDDSVYVKNFIFFSKDNTGGLSVTNDKGNEIILLFSYTKTNDNIYNLEIYVDNEVVDKEITMTSIYEFTLDLTGIYSMGEMTYEEGL